MTDSASAREAGDEVLYGIITASSRSAPIASATRIRDDRRIDPARQPEHEAVESGLLELAADELGDDPAGDVGVDGELRWQLERRVSRSFGRGHAPRSRACGPRSPWVPNPIGSLWRLGRGHVEAGFGGRVGSRDRPPARPARR